jgi:hypothetical protein
MEFDRDAVGTAGQTASPLKILLLHFNPGLTFGADRSCCNLKSTGLYYIY